jgi:hypothetical protein
VYHSELALFSPRRDHSLLILNPISPKSRAGWLQFDRINCCAIERNALVTIQCSVYFVDIPFRYQARPAVTECYSVGDTISVSLRITDIGPVDALAPGIYYGWSISLNQLDMPQM